MLIRKFGKHHVFHTWGSVQFYQDIKNARDRWSLCWARTVSEARRIWFHTYRIVSLSMSVAKWGYKIVGTTNKKFFAITTVSWSHLVFLFFTISKKSSQMDTSSLHFSFSKWKLFMWTIYLQENVIIFIICDLFKLNAMTQLLSHFSISRCRIGADTVMRLCVDLRCELLLVHAESEFLDQRDRNGWEVQLE